MQIVLNPHYNRVRAAENAPRSPFHVLERHHGLAEIVERGAGVQVERLSVNQAHLEREIIILSNAIVAAGAVDPLIDALVCETDAEEAASFALGKLDLPSIASRVQILQAENERLRARVEELEERHERPRRRDRMEAAQ